MKKIEFPLGKIKEIIAMYEDKEIPVKEILETYHISRPVLSRILKEEKVPFRLPKATGPRTNVKLKICHVCGKSAGVEKAMFCPYCGADIRSKSERLIYRLADLWTLIYPRFKDHEEKKEAGKLFDELKEYLKNH